MSESPWQSTKSLWSQDALSADDTLLHVSRSCGDPPDGGRIARGWDRLDVSGMGLEQFSRFVHDQLPALRAFRVLAALKAMPCKVA